MNMDAKDHDNKDAEEVRVAIEVPPSWARLIRYCEEMKHGELRKLQITY